MQTVLQGDGVLGRDGNHMTIREHYELVVKYTKYGAIAAVGAVLIAFMWRYPNAPRWQGPVLGLAIGAVLGPAIIILGRVLYRCPRCHADFQKLRVKEFGRGYRDKRMYWQLWDACPQCHVSFDDPWG